MWEPDNAVRYPEVVIRPLYLHNGHIRPSHELTLSAGQVGLFTGWGVFSTVKISSGVLFAFPRHWARMKRDAELLRIPFPWSAEELERELLKLVEANGETDATLRVTAFRNTGTMWAAAGQTREVELVAFTAARNKWGAEARLGVVEQARHAANVFAGAKTLSWAANLVMYESAHARGWDEVVLLNERGEVSECTSANLFAAFGGHVVTPPLSSGCLPGITRELLLGEVRADGYEVVEGVLRLEDLERADGVFMTSSTRDLLPVAEVEGRRIARGTAACEALKAAFHAYEARYVQDWKSATRV